MKTFSIVVVLFLTFFNRINAQENGETENHSNKETKEETYHKHVISLGLGHANVSQGIGENGNTTWLVLPSWMLDYNYWFKENWAVGLHTDVILENFVVDNPSENVLEEESQNSIEREKPIAIVGAVSYKPLEWLSLIAGGGVEYEATESFGLMRFGVEPHMEIHEKWEIFVNLNYDIKFKAYDTYGLSVGIGRGF